MTEQEKRRVPLGQILLGLALFFCHALFLRNHSIAVAAVQEGLLLCAKAVIPSLFPFLVLSSMLTRGNFAELFFAPFARKFSWNPYAFCALLLGVLCGAPVGAACLSDACKEGKLSKGAAERLLPLIACPSLPFVVGTVGGVFLKDVKLGWLLWLSTLPGLLLSALLLLKKTDSEPPFSPMLSVPPRFASLLSFGITSAVRSLLLVSAYVVFFSALFSALRYCFSALDLPDALSAFFYSVIELSGGLAEACALESALTLPLCGFAAGFSGFAIFFQVLSLTDKQGLSPKYYLPIKLLQGLLSALLFPLFCALAQK